MTGLHSAGLGRTVGDHTSAGATMADREVILEASRHNGRRPRYHRGAIQSGTGVRLDPPQCNLDQVGVAVRQLDALPELRRPWSQLCKRCWGGTPVYRTAMALGAEFATVAPPRRRARP